MPVNRSVGLETEYGCLSNDSSGPAAAVGRVRNWVFDEGKFGLADLHQQDWDEPVAYGHPIGERHEPRWIKRIHGNDAELELT